MRTASAGYTSTRWSTNRGLASLPSSALTRTGTLRYYLKSVRGVADVASLGGYVRQYQVNVDPNRLRARGLSIRQVVDAVRGGNAEVGGRVIEFGGTEYMVRGRGYAQTIADFENIVLSANDNGTPVRVKDIGQVGSVQTCAAGPPTSTATAKRCRAS
jgi:Cu(I)/Ag(I) efflux system membrane protein CusA/SilA